MADEKWEEYAQLLLRGLQTSEDNDKEHSEKISRLENQVGNLMTMVKIGGPILGALLIDAIRSYLAGG